jgi:hypothetical protein
MNTLLTAGMLILLGSSAVGCSSADVNYDLGVYNPTPDNISSITVELDNGNTWPFANLGSNSLATVNSQPGPIPDAADVSWTDAAGKAHHQHVQITPLPAPTKTSFSGPNRDFYLVFDAVGSVKVVYHDPRFKE